MQVGNRTIDEAFVAEVVGEVLRRLSDNGGMRSERTPVPAGTTRPGALEAPWQVGSNTFGIFRSVDAAVQAAGFAQRQLMDASVAARARAVECIRKVLRRDQEELGRLEFEETKLGKLAHKFEKLEVAAGVPGVEMLRTEATSGDHGLTVTEYAPFGVIGVVTPVTHSVPTLGCNAIMMVAAGNALVCSAHPSGARCAAEATRRFNREIVREIGIDNLVCAIENPSIETATQIFQHPGVHLLCVTGGPAVARAALSSGKRAIAAGPGNPPAVVDETADLEKAAKGIIAGAAYDNNLLCIGEKEVFVVEAVAERLLDAMSRHGGHRLSREEIDRLARAVLFKDEASGHWLPRKEFVGQDPQVIARAIKVEVAPSVKLLFGLTDESNPLLPCEQMMPLLPVVAVRDVDEAIRLAVKYEHGFKHTAVMWSRNVENLTKMGKACEATVYVKNGPSPAGLGVGGQGYGSFSIATTGEGITSPLTFTRYRRCTMVGSLRIF
ncbi:MAG: aldehyde dehydrogenase [Planctomycetota bacterium]